MATGVYLRFARRDWWSTTASLQRIEVSSFVSPRWIPQLADAEKLMSLVPRREGVIFTALVPNLKGLERPRSMGSSAAAAYRLHTPPRPHP